MESPIQGTKQTLQDRTGSINNMAYGGKEMEKKERRKGTIKDKINKV